MKSAGATRSRHGVGTWCVAMTGVALLACSGPASDHRGSPSEAGRPARDDSSPVAVAVAPRDGGAAAGGAAAGALADAGPGGRLILSWGGGNMFGSDQLTIDAQLDLRHEYREASGRVTRRGPVRLKPSDLRDLEAVLRRNRVCGLVSAPGYLPVPEETTTTLAVELGGMSCVVGLYANEWRSQPGAAAIERAIAALSLRVQGAGP
jgi:hypothetical protein